MVHEGFVSGCQDRENGGIEHCSKCTHDGSTLKCKDCESGFVLKDDGSECVGQ